MAKLQIYNKEFNTNVANHIQLYDNYWMSTWLNFSKISATEFVEKYLI